MTSQAQIRNSQPRHLLPSIEHTVAVPYSAKDGPYSGDFIPDLTQIVAEAKTTEDLFLIMANAARQVVGAQQIFVFCNAPAPHIVAVSSMPSVNRQSPLIQDLEKIFRILLDAGELQTSRIFSLGADTQDVSQQLKSYPFRSLIWTPLRSEGERPSAGILYTRQAAWRTEYLAHLDACAQTYNDRLQSIASKSPAANFPARLQHSTTIGKAGLVVAMLLLIAMCMPTTMTVSAPFQVSSQNHLIVSAPIQGTIEQIYVSPGEKVAIDQPLIKFADTVYRNQVAIAERAVEMSQAELKRASQLSFEDEEGRRQVGQLKADVAIKRAELDFATEQLLRSTVRADLAGTVILSNQDALIGRPFSIGERILEIADPDSVQFEIFLDIADAIDLSTGTVTKLFPDATPFKSYTARLTQISYQAEPDALGMLSYRLIAKPENGTLRGLKLGTSGTAKIYGKKVPLAFYLFRKPITVIRQWLGV
ncbi:CusB/HlyD membrane fusion family barrel-sandwich protein [Hoeflea halophila]|uniref:CusB/HlyD membrane fusion family barrel-sandwich protein n=1 Tax=Hoeflea halophila TaxID=714899 RepID=A0A286II35_9HYPH|nr:HlyD family efflux transporter periplasmic adaptor subunit [Hoeflea halophila]SOE19044.1 CusB/HlyD membrane fusion family barrel-sandwich protein [Hoeflea halophila]